MLKKIVILSLISATFIIKSSNLTNQQQRKLLQDMINSSSQPVQTVVNAIPIPFKLDDNNPFKIENILFNDNKTFQLSLRQHDPSLKNKYFKDIHKNIAFIRTAGFEAIIVAPDSKEINDIADRVICSIERKY